MSIPFNIKQLDEQTVWPLMSPHKNDINATLSKVVKALEDDAKKRIGQPIDEQIRLGEFVNDWERPLTARQIIILLDAIGVKFGDNDH